MAAKYNVSQQGVLLACNRLKQRPRLERTISLSSSNFIPSARAILCLSFNPRPHQVYLLSFRQSLLLLLLLLLRLNWGCLSLLLKATVCQCPEPARNYPAYWPTPCLHLCTHLPDYLLTYTFTFQCLLLLLPPLLILLMLLIQVGVKKGVAAALGANEYVL